MDPATLSSTSTGQSPEDIVRIQITRLRAAQRSWAERPIRERLQIVRRVRKLMASRAPQFALLSAALRERPLAEMLSAEVLPLLEAHRYVEKEAARLLAPQKLGGHRRPLWLSRTNAEIHREPRGVVLIIGPANYPLLLPGVQILQALASGNVVLFKPAPGTAGLAGEMREAWIAGGLAPELFELLPESAESVHDAIYAGVDFVVLTGSAEAGEAVMKSCAERLTPTVLELSGCDAVLVREDADVELAAAALAFGLRFNAGATCIAPRRVFVARQIAERLEAHLSKHLENVPSFSASERITERCIRLISDAERRGATIVAGNVSETRVMLPLVIAGGALSGLPVEDEIFAPVMVITFVESDEQALELARRSSYALGASIFSRDAKTARSLARRLNAGVVLINDMIVPTADPRLPFGGRGRSGFGVTRGSEGLLTMTVPKTVTFTKGTRRPHFAPVSDSEADFFSGYIALSHAGGWRQRLKGLQQFWNGLKALSRTRRSKSFQESNHDHE